MIGAGPLVDGVPEECPREFEGGSGGGADLSVGSGTGGSASAGLRKFEPVLRCSHELIDCGRDCHTQKVNHCKSYIKDRTKNGGEWDVLVVLCQSLIHYSASLNDSRVQRWQEQDLMFCERTRPMVNEDGGSSQLQGMGNGRTKKTDQLHPKCIPELHHSPREYSAAAHQQASKQSS